jgi:CheY-like chemotaxis protein
VVAASAGPGKGSEFTVRLPALAASSPDPAASPAGVTARRARRILLVEDNADAREALALLLESWGHRVEQAADGPAGLELARADPPDVALIDVGLPGIDGYTLAREIRAEPRCDGVRLIALTGYSRARDRERGLDAGFDAYMVKPVDPEELRGALSGPDVP